MQKNKNIIYSFFYQFFFFIILIANFIPSSKAVTVNPISPGFRYDGREKIIRAKVIQEENKKALVEVEQKLVSQPNNLDLLKKKIGLLIDLEQYQKAGKALQNMNQSDLNNPEIQKLKKIVEKELDKLPKNELGIGADWAGVSDIQANWNYESIHYYRFTKFGTYGLRFNHGNRYAIGGNQYVLEAYPVLNQWISLAFTYGISRSSQRVFPKNQFLADIYFNISKIELSLGHRSIKSFNQNIYTYTGSLGLYFSDYFIWLRPYHYTPKSHSAIEGGITRYFNDAKSYISVKYMTGNVPDIGDVPPLNQILMPKFSSIVVNGRFSLVCNLFVKPGVAYSTYKYPSGLDRKIKGVFAELLWQF